MKNRRVMLRLTGVIGLGVRSGAVSLAKNLEDGTTRVATVAFDAWGRVRETPGGQVAFEVDAPSGTADRVHAAQRFWGALYQSQRTRTVVWQAPPRR